MRPLLYTVVFMGTLLCSFLQASELVIAENGSSRYQIVLPKETGDSQLDRYLERGAELLQEIIRHSTGAVLPVISFQKCDPKVPSIFIGTVPDGVNEAKFGHWEHGILVQNKNIYLYGRDRGNNLDRSQGCRVTAYELGSVKAVTSFVEQFCKTAFIYPGKDGIFIPQGQRITIPSHTAEQRKPKIEYALGSHFGVFYSIANNFLGAPWYGNYGGHSHNIAIPFSKYAKTHPEYFALQHGKRRVHGESPHYCFANEGVRKLIYQELLSHLDEGYSIAQLAQSDGFLACQCQKCKTLFGTSSPGEQIWIMHREIAKKLLQDRPGKRACIIAYGPTGKLPETFKTFPENVKVELAPCNKEILERWRKYSVPGGFVAYLYTWGIYHPEGFTPVKTFEFLEDEVKMLHDGNVQGITMCGFGNLYGLEGPFYYLYGKLLADPTLSRTALLDSFYQAAFGSAASTMSLFYSQLNDRLKLNLKERVSDWNNPERLQNNLQLLTLRYPAEILERMEKKFSMAETTPGLNPQQKKYLSIIRNEWDYLRYTAMAANTFRTFQQKSTWENFEETLKWCIAREKLINTLPAFAPVSNSLIELPYRGFGSGTWGGGVYADLLRRGGIIEGTLGFPFVWDAPWMLKHEIQPAGRNITLSSKPQLLIRKDNEWHSKSIADSPVRLSCNLSGKQLIITLVFKNWSASKIANAQIRIYLADRAWYGKAKGKLKPYVKIMNSRENAGNGNRYAPIPEKEEVVSISGDTLTIQLPLPDNVHDKTTFNIAVDDLIWECNLAQKSTAQQYDVSGTLHLK